MTDEDIYKKDKFFDLFPLLYTKYDDVKFKLHRYELMKEKLLVHRDKGKPYGFCMNLDSWETIEKHFPELEMFRPRHAENYNEDYWYNEHNYAIREMILNQIIEKLKQKI